MELTLERPSTEQEAVHLLETVPESAVYAGGTELVLALKEGLLGYRCLVDVKRLPTLQGVEVDEQAGQIAIGAAVTHREVERAPVVRDRLPLLSRVETLVGNPRVRAAGTLVGNLCFADPHSDVAVLGHLLDAELELVGGDRLPLARAVRDYYTTCLGPGQIVRRLRIPIPPPGSRLAYQRIRFTERPAVAAAVRLDVEAARIRSARVVVGCVEPVPRARGAAGLLAGVALDRAPEAAMEVAHAVATETEPLGDHEAGTDFKRHLAGELARRAIEAAAAGGME